MELAYVIVLLFGIILTAYNWFYLQEIKAAQFRVGFTVPNNARFFLKGVFYASFLSCSIIVLAIFAHI
ncbi:hypothetical protein C4559_01740 [Candidatus Microgenomates bacterium]|nr:MAG: hypothetical protein C4559_01740 [Candidatus Microgenomates bacterium]